jgi:predicted DNA binding protein
MKLNLIEVAKPDVHSFTLFAEPDRNLLRETKKVRIKIHNTTKTRVSTSITFGSYCANINFDIDGFKTHKDSYMNYLSGTQTTSHYFVKSKKQNLESYKEYVKKCVIKSMTYLGVNDLDELTIELESANF